uniref:Uncharacterized protein n=1 Tax=Myoviridae sp. ct31P9 TaxID=2827657 RepID=A0A8S5T3Q3_9CAUD|nr:MAG TPA: hypothetical protein [Myoviridae sp. ct31P9]DAR98439.1 MAG TPA: hypothetical protein [Caudoviricetes sp.]
MKSGRPSPLSRDSAFFCVLPVSIQFWCCFLYGSLL